MASCLALSSRDLLKDPSDGVMEKDTLPHMDERLFRMGVWSDGDLCVFHWVEGGLNSSL